MQPVTLESDRMPLGDYRSTAPGHNTPLRVCYFGFRSLLQSEVCSTENPIVAHAQLRKDLMTATYIDHDNASQVHVIMSNLPISDARLEEIAAEKRNQIYK